jgi:cytochrome c oxidase assembly protein subunit 11
MKRSVPNYAVLPPPLVQLGFPKYVVYRRTLSTSTEKEAQKAAYEFYAKRRAQRSWFFRGGFFQSQKPRSAQTAAQENVNTAWYLLALTVGTLGASYAAVPLYKVFCQTTGYGGTTQRVWTTPSTSGEPGEGATKNYNSLETFLQRALSTVLPPQRGARVHTWTDENAAERLRQLKPVTNAELITVRFDTTVPDVMPWSFVPVQLDVKIVPGETALSFFRVTNHSDKAITGVATYNVHPPKVGLYFQKIQCFCFEEQRLLPGETVDMPVFFFIDPEMLDDPQVSYVKSVTLSYTFFKTDEDDEDS